MEFCSSLVTRHSSLVTRHSSLVTRHSSLVTRHSSLVTRHSSIVTRQVDKYTKIKKNFLLIASLFVSLSLSGCGWGDFSIITTNLPDVVPLQEKASSAWIGETVKTTYGTPNYEVTGTFNEVSSAQTTSSGYQLQGVFQ